MSEASPPRPQPLHLIAAFASGGLLTMMVFLNGESGRTGGALFSSWLAHGTGTVAAMILVGLLWRTRPKATSDTRSGPPLWAYLGGLSGAVTVMLTSTAVNSPLAVAGTLALGLAGQVTFSLAADMFGLFGLPRRRPDLRDLGAITLIVLGSLLIILLGQGSSA
jgi:transporter family-2 protein